MRLVRIAASILLFTALTISAVPPASGQQRPGGFYTEDGSYIPPPVQDGQLPEHQLDHGVDKPVGPGVLTKRVARVSAAEFGKVLQAKGFATAKGLLLPQWWRVAVPSGRTAAQVVASLKALPEVEVAEEDAVYESAFTPDDTYFSSRQWGPQIVQAPSAWNVTKGSRNVLIAVVDSGIDYTHPDRPTDLWLGRDFYNDDRDPYDDWHHGTHVTGIAAAAANNSIGIAGMCPSCEVLAVKSQNSVGKGLSSTIGDAITYAADWGKRNQKRTIINLSIDSSDSYDATNSTYLGEAVAYAQSLGALVVAAAGNGGHKPTSYPAAFPGVLSVAATDDSDVVASYSQYAAIAAPGGTHTANLRDLVWSTVPGKVATPPYKGMAGTSMASPHVAGAAGLVWSAFPSLSADDVANELKMTADVPAGWDASFGTGRLNVNRALLRFTATNLPTATINSLYSARIGTYGGVNPKHFSLVSGSLPPGFSLGATDGTLTGTPTAPGTYSLTVRVSDSFGERVTRTFTLRVLAYSVFVPLVSRN